MPYFSTICANEVINASNFWFAEIFSIRTWSEVANASALWMGVYNYSMCTMLYETLLKYEDGEVKGNLAESYSFNEDGTVMTLTLRQGITFHDGTPFNAEAVKKNLDFMHSKRCLWLSI
jgi:nickel transport system substrate-binding protein